MSKPLPDVRVGDVWRSCDKRDACHHDYKVLAIDGDRAKCAGAFRRSNIRLDRFRPTSTGYRLTERDGKPVEQS